MISVNEEEREKKKLETKLHLVHASRILRTAFLLKS